MMHLGGFHPLPQAGVATAPIMMGGGRLALPQRAAEQPTPMGERAAELTACHADDTLKKLSRQLGGHSAPMQAGVAQPATLAHQHARRLAAGGDEQQVIPMRMPDPDKPGCFVVLYLPVSYMVLDTPSASVCAPEAVLRQRRTPQPHWWSR